jgi:hypothetical protein
MGRTLTQKFRTFIFIAIVLALFIGSKSALGMGILNLPPDPVLATHGNWNQGTTSTIDIFLSEVPEGYDVMNGTYAGWCVEDNHRPNLPEDAQVWLYDSTDDPENLPESYQDILWDLINYMLNHKLGSVQDVNVALWLLTGTYDGTFGPITAAAQAMVDEAIANGEDFVPGPGEIVAVILYGDGIGPDGFQDTLIEVTVPPEDYEGCTPGYWKQSHHFDSWVYYMPSNKFSDVFDRVIEIKLKKPKAKLKKAKHKKAKRKIVYVEDPTLEQALKAKGGKINALARHTVAALLNAASPDVDYEYSESEVIQMFQDAYDTGDYEPTKDMFEMANESFCPLD